MCLSDHHKLLSCEQMLESLNQSIFVAGCSSKYTLEDLSKMSALTLMSFLAPNGIRFKWTPKNDCK